MKKFMSFTAIGLVAIALAACSGGGGGGPAPSTTTPPTASVTCPDGSAAANAAACTVVTLAITPANGSTSIQPGDLTASGNGITVVSSGTLTAGTCTATLQTGNSSGAQVGRNLVPSDTGFKIYTSNLVNYMQPLYVSASCIDSVGRTVTANTTFTTSSVSCMSPKVTDSTGTQCIAPPVTVLHYTDKVYAIWTAAYPFAVTKTGVTRVANKTQYPGLLPFINCWLASKQLTDGKVLTNCQDNINPPYARHIFYIDPTKDEIYDYTGAVPTDVVWKDVQHFDPATPTWSAKAKVADGWYFTPNTTTWVLNFQADATGIITVVKAGTFEADGNINILMSYTN